MKTLISLLLFAGLGLAQTKINGSRVITGYINYCADAGSTDAYACSLAEHPGAYGVGTHYRFKANTSNTGGATLNLNSIGAVALVKYVGGAAQALADNDIRAGGLYEVMYDGTNFQVVSVLGNGGTTYTLPTATGSVLGGIKIGTGLSIDGDGVVTASAGSAAICDFGNPAVSCLVEDFITGSATSGGIGSNGLRFAAVSSGTYVPLNVGTNAITNHPGVGTITSTTATNSGGVVSAGNTSTTANINLSDLLNEEWEVSWVFKLESTADARMRLGISSNLADITPGTGGVTMMVRYDTDAAFSDNTKNTVGSFVAQFCGYTSGTCGDTDGVYAVFNIQPDTNWHRARIYRSGTTVNFQIDANTAKTMCASGCDMTTPSPSSPTSVAMAPNATFGISSTTQRKLYLDWMLWKMTGLTRY